MIQSRYYKVLLNYGNCTNLIFSGESPDALQTSGLPTYMACRNTLLLIWLLSFWTLNIVWDHDYDLTTKLAFTVNISICFNSWIYSILFVSAFEIKNMFKKNTRRLSRALSFESIMHYGSNIWLHPLKSQCAI